MSKALNTAASPGSEPMLYRFDIFLQLFILKANTLIFSQIAEKVQIKPSKVSCHDMTIRIVYRSNVSTICIVSYKLNDIEPYQIYTSLLLYQFHTNATGDMTMAKYTRDQAGPKI